MTAPAADTRVLLDDLRRKGVAVRAEAGRLRVPTDALPPHYLALLRAWEPAVVAVLGGGR